MGQARLGRRLVLGAGGLAVMALGGVSLFRGPRRGGSEPVLRRAAELARRQGVRIVFHGLPDGAASGDAEPLPEELGEIASAVEPGSLPWALDGMERSLGAYPDGFYGRLCSTLFVCGALTVTADGRQAGGTYGQDWIALVAPSGLGRDTVEATCRLGIHHEFSSLVWNRALLLPGKWATLLPPGRASAPSAHPLDAAQQPAPPPETGFLSAYGATTPENDFNVYAETVFTEPARLMELAHSQRLVASKLALLMDTYIQLEPRMGDVFRGLGLGAFIGASRELVQGGGLAPLNIPAGQLVKP